MVDDKMIGARVRAVRERLGWSQMQLLRRCNVLDASTLSLKERGLRPWRATEVIDLAAAMGVKPGDLLHDETPST